MAALLGADLVKAQAIADAAAEGEVCTVANDNDPSQVVISGAKGAIDRAVAIAKDHGAKRAVLLPVSAPFHCPMMQPAADAMAKANDSEYGLSAAIATRNPKYMHDFAQNIQSGTVKINRTTTGNLVNAPFGGVKNSSTSTFRESGRVGMEFFTQTKIVYRAA